MRFPLAFMFFAPFVMYFAVRAGAESVLPIMIGIFALTLGAHIAFAKAKS